jgi:hypothetical protein
MKLNDISVSNLLVEATAARAFKARIDHPEDLVAEQGAAGATKALNALISLAKQPRSVTVKFDGSPALIFGWDANGFVLTDKSGFGAKGYDGMARSPQAVEAMLKGETGRRVKFSSEEDKAARYAYAEGIAKLYPLLEALVPKKFKGYLQGDLLWQGTPVVRGDHYIFGPLKISYSIPVGSDLGQQIAASKAGMVIHSVYASRQDEEPRAIEDVTKIGLNTVPGLVVVPHHMSVQDALQLPMDLIRKTRDDIAENEPELQALFNSETKSLPGFFKSFLAYKAGTGSNNYDRAGEEFTAWMDSDASKASDRMRVAVKMHVSQNQAGYAALWNIISDINSIKLALKSQLDARVKGSIGAKFSDKAPQSLRGKSGHEGFVADTDHGKIKLVNRSEFMRKETAPVQAESVAIDQDILDLIETASGGGTSAGGVASIANPMGGVISRTPNLFGYIPAAEPKRKRKRRSRAAA